jgi:protein-disulfide isomerase
MLTRRTVVAALTAVGATALLPSFITQALAQSPADVAVPSPLGDLILGDEKASVTIIEYASMTCPHCGAFATETYPKLKASYIDTGKVKYIFREFPLDDLAMAGAMLARCAGKTDSKRAFDLIEIFFQKQREWVVQRPIEPIKNLIKQVGLGEKDFEACLNDRDLSAKILEGQERASKVLGVNSTPTFFINGQMQKGAMSFDELEKVLKPLLNT